MDDFTQLGWGEAKAEINLLLHRIPFTAASAVLRDPHRVTIGRAGPDGGATTVGVIDGRAVTVATRAATGGAARILSARPATPAEWRAVARPGDAALQPRDPALPPADAIRLGETTAAERQRNAEADPDNPPLGRDELAKGLEARRIRALRVSSGLDREAFAARFHLDAERLAAWEWALARPDPATLAYLTVIACEPDAVARALGRTLSAGPRDAAESRFSSSWCSTPRS